MIYLVKRLALTAWVVAFFYPAVIAAQTISFAPVQSIQSGSSGGRAIVAADFDRDGKLDFAVASFNSSNVSVLLGAGNGTFNTPPAFTVSFPKSPVALAAADFDNDGIVDLAVADSAPSSNSSLYILLGNGDGTFASPVTISLGVQSISHSIAVGDFDRDGDLDLAVTSDSSKTLSILLGDGSGGFSVANTTITHFPQSVVAVDFDRDGKLDLAVADNTTVFVFPGVGDGTFGSGIDIVQGSGPGFIAVGDFDRDGILDLAVTSLSSKKVFIRRGTGNLGLGAASFAAGVGFAVSGIPQSILAADLNGDGSLDLVTTSLSSSSASVLAGLGTGAFAKAKSFALGAVSFAAAVGDFDADGRPDILAARLTTTNTSLLLNATAFTFSGDLAAASPVAVGDAPRAVATGDFNRDGRVDLAVANAGAGNVSIRLGSGGGGFTAAADVPVGAAPAAIAIADFDRDGKLDMVVANSGAGNVSVFLGNGNGTFTAASTPTVTVGATPVAAVAGDWDGDGKPDVAVVNQGSGSGSVSILLGNGDGTFTGPSDVTVGSSPSAVVAGDFNGDGILDLAVTDSTDNNVSILIGAVDGTFTQPDLPFSTGAGPSAVATGDFDADGKLDLAVANATDDNVSILLGNGNGTFAAAVSLPAGNSPSSIVAADFNRDGKLDLAVTLKDDDKVAVLIGDGTGTFDGTLFSSPFSVGNAPSALATGDFNNDGRLDLAVANENTDNVSIMLNTSPSPVVLSPAAGETWNVNSQQTIRWVDSGAGATVNIQLSRDNGATWTTIFKKTSNDGIQNWTVTVPATNVNQAQIRVCPTLKGALCLATSDTFTIAP